MSFKTNVSGGCPDLYDGTTCGKSRERTILNRY